MDHKFSKRARGGFTMVELTLAMAFVAILMLAIASVVIQMGNVYNKGITMKSVEQVGRLITTDIRRTVTQGRGWSSENVDNYCLYQTESEIKKCSDVTIDSSDYDYNRDSPSSIRGGRFCTGTYTYVWNYGSVPDASSVNKYDGSPQKINFVRVQDDGAVYCSKNNSGGLSNIPYSEDKATDLLKGSGMNLAVHRFIIKKSLSSKNQVIYEFKLRIGTGDIEFIETGGDCKSPSDDVQAQNFCAVNELEFTALNDTMGGY